ncbi:MAG: Gfo/Idh/MocA family protein [Saccharospirillum sp.]
MIRWAAVGIGQMANLFVKDARHGQGGRFTAAWSRNRERAEAFARQHGLAQSFDDYDALLADDAIDAIYIASPHTAHVDQAIAALEAGKAVLVEKPVAVNANDAEHLYQTAARCGRFCQEALWTRFNPVYQTLLSQARSGRLGRLCHSHSNFGFVAPTDPTHRLNNPQLAGGALLDMGLYPLLLPLDLFGEPDHIDGRVTLGATGVDESADLVLHYPGGQRAVVSYSLRNAMPNQATISGSEGWVELQSPWFAPNAARWQQGEGPVRWQQYELVGRGWHYEFSAANRAIARGALECEEHNQADSLRLMRLLDRIRSEFGPKYPFE